MINVVKIGGNVIGDEVSLQAFCREFASMPRPKILVHGGGPLAAQMQEKLGIMPVRIEGRRVTDADTLQIVTMVYAGWCSKHIVALLQGYGCDAIGLSGCDAGCITAGKRAPRRLSDGTTVVDYGFVGDVRPASVRAGFVKTLLDLGLTPVFSAINHDGHGQLLNTNADTMAASVAAALGARLTYRFEKPGVLSASGSVIPCIDRASYEDLKASGTVSGGMLPKLDNAFDALREGVPEVFIGGTRICL